MGVFVILTDRRERTRFVRFAVVGSAGAVVDFVVLNLLVGLLSLEAVIAQAISFSAAVVSNYFWNRYWTYPDSRTKPVARQLVEFAVVSVIGLGIRSGIFLLVESPLTELFVRTSSFSLPLSPVFLSRNLTLALAIGVIMFWNFFVNRYWTFADVE